MGNQKHTHVTTQGGLYFRVEGKLQELKKGTPLTLNRGQAKKMVARGMVEPIDKEQGADVSGGGSTADAETLKAEGEQLKADAETLKAEGEQLKADAETLKAEGEQLKADAETLKADAETLKAEGEKAAKTAAKELKAAKALMGGGAQ